MIRNGQSRYVVLLAQNLFMIPGGTSGCLQLFDRSSTVVRTWTFPTGHCNALKDASLDYSAGLDIDLLTIRTAPVVNGRDLAAEHFAIGGDELRLVRLEEQGGSSPKHIRAGGRNWC
jgi:hypothetical protein